jgi:hypothetical protein
MRHRSSRAMMAGCLALLLAAAPVRATDEVHDDFGAGLDPSLWIVQVSPDLPAYHVDASAGDVHLWRPADPAHAGMEAVWVRFAHPVVGDFDAEIQYHQPSLALTSGIGNDVAFRVRFPALTTSVRRSSDALAPAQNYHAWAEPPGFAYGTVATTDLSGVLRITRTSILVSFYGNGQLLWSTAVFDDTLRSLEFGLENRGTADSSSVHFDDFVMTANQVVWTAAVTASPPEPLPRRPGASALGDGALELELPAPEPVAVDWLDLQGRVVLRSPAAWTAAGRSRRAPPDGARALRRGLYFARVRAPGWTVVAKAVLGGA